MSVLPGQLALTSIADGALAVASDIRNNYAAIQTEANALLTILGAGTTGQVLTSGGGTTVAWGPTYTAYTPTWTASGTAPAIGNATAVAQYAQIGKLVHAYGSIAFGTTSTFGTGTYRWALPVTASANALAAIHSGTAVLVDTSASAEGLARVGLQSTTLMQLVVGATYLGTTSVIAQTAPWTWAQTDLILWNIVYEAA